MSLGEARREQGRGRPTQGRHLGRGGVCVWTRVCGFCKAFLTNKNKNSRGLSAYLSLGWREKLVVGGALWRASLALKGP